MKKPKKKNPNTIPVNMRQPTMLMAKVRSKMEVDIESLRMKRAGTVSGLVFCALRDYVEDRWKP